MASPPTTWTREDTRGKGGWLVNIDSPLDEIDQALDEIASTAVTSWTQEAP